MKKCSRCGKSQDESEFYADKRATDGKQSHCRTCMKSRVKEYYSVRENKDKHNAAVQRSREKHAEKEASRMVFDGAMACREIAVLPCFCCGEEKVEGHHPDYSQPLSVVWLCKKHHSEVHRGV